LTISGECFCGAVTYIVSGQCDVVAGEIHGVTLGCVNDDPDIEIGRHIFVGSKATWEVIPEGVTTFEERP